MENVGSSLSKYGVIPLVHGVTEKILGTKPQLIVNGFKKAGLFPWDPSAPNSKRMDPSKIYVPQEESVVKMRSEPTVNGNLTSCPDMQRSEHVAESCKEITAKIEENSPTLDTGDLPMYTPRFLARYELLLSEGELKAFESLFAAKRFNVDNPPYQTWLVLKLASLPIAEQEVMGQVFSIFCCTLFLTK